MIPARTWGVHAVVMAPTERLKLRRPMAAATGKKNTTSLSLFMEAYGLDIEEELSTMATQHWAGKWSYEQKEAWMRQIREVQTWTQVTEPAGAVMCETRDLGLRWLQRHTSMFSDEKKLT